MWFIPGVMVPATVVVCIVLLRVDRKLVNLRKQLQSIFSNCQSCYKLAVTTKSDRELLKLSAIWLELIVNADSVAVAHYYSSR